MVDAQRASTTVFISWAMFVDYGFPNGIFIP